MRLYRHYQAILATTMMSALLATNLIAGKPIPPSQYSFTDLGGFPGLTSIQSEARAVSNINSRGLLSVVGNSYTATPHQADPAEWTTTAAGQLLGVTDLGAPASSIVAEAFGVNDAGVSVGSVIQDATGKVFPGFVCVPTVGTFPLPSFGGMVSAGNGINNSGEIVGYADDSSETRWGALWQVDNSGYVSAPINLGTFIPSAINASGEMAGTQGGLATVAWFDGAGTFHTQSLGVLKGDIGSYASGINGLGDVVGTSYAPGASAGSILPHAFLWRAGSMSSLGHLGGGTSAAAGINDAGVVVGTSSDRQGSSVAFLWRNGVINNLNTLAGLDASRNATTATGINNKGHIVGACQVAISRKSTEIHAYLLTPAP